MNNIKKIIRKLTCGVNLWLILLPKSFRFLANFGGSMVAGSIQSVGWVVIHKKKKSTSN